MTPATLSDYPRKQRTKKEDGSPNVSEIELNRMLSEDWNRVVKWLKNFDLLRSSGLEKLTLHA